MEAGTLNQVYVGFSAIEEEWDDRGELPRRLVTRARLYEISLVLWGAYGAATSASVVGRSSPAARAEAAMRARYKVLGTFNADRFQIFAR